MIPRTVTICKQMKRRTIWSTAMAAAATTAFTLNAPLSSSGGSMANASPSSPSFSTSLNAVLSSLSSANTTHCEENGGGHENESIHVTENPFDESVLSYDHYNGVTIRLDKYEDDKIIDHSSASHYSSFATKLNDALTIWKAEGRKGIWIHTNTKSANFIPDCVNAGFQFHKILAQKNEKSDSKTEESTNESSNSLVLSRWLPTDTPSRLPHGPTHQVGVGVVLLNPLDPSQMLVVRELSGPAAKYNLWKMPTGLVDPREYVPEAASRELLEETGIEAKMSSILCIRQAHRSNADTSDMFFVCKMAPLLENSDKKIKWKRQETEIADIQWMSVQDYCNQDRWQGSPLYENLNDCVLRASLQEIEWQKIEENGEGSKPVGIEHRQLEVGFGRTDGKSEALFLPTSSLASTKSKL